jgi:hypothetical protein
MPEGLSPADVPTATVEYYSEAGDCATREDCPRPAAAPPRARHKKKAVGLDPPPSVRMRTPRQAH